MSNFFKNHAKGIAKTVIALGALIILVDSIVMATAKSNCLRESRTSDCVPTLAIGIVGCVLLAIGSLAWEACVLNEQQEEGARLLPHG